jgi:hypothetical protein
LDKHLAPLMIETGNEEEEEKDGGVILKVAVAAVRID